MTTALLPLPIFRAFDNAGLPLAGGLLYSYAAGTTTPQNTFSDAAGSSPNTNPVVLDTTGSATVRLDPTLSYKFVLKDSTATTTYWTEDNYQASTLVGTSIAAALNTVTSVAPTADKVQTAAEITAGVTPTNYAYLEFDARRYGYTADGSTDNATALASAVAVASVKGGTIQLPPGQGNFSSFPSLDGLQNVIFQGVGSANSGAHLGTQLQYTGTGSGNIISLRGSQGIMFRGIYFTHTQAGFTGTYIRFGNNGADCTFASVLDCFFGSSVSAVNFLNLDKTINFTCERTLFFNSAHAILGRAAGSYSNVARFRDCEFYHSTQTPVMWPGQSWTFDGCTFEALSTGLASAIDSGSSSTPCNGLTVRGCWFGDVTVAGGTWLSLIGNAVDISGNYFGGYATTTQAIQIGTGGLTSSGVSIKGNNFDTFSIAISFTGNLTGLCCEANSFNNVTTVFSGSSSVATGYANVGSNSGASSLGSTHEIIGNNGFVARGDRIIQQWGSATVTVGTPLAVTFATNGIAFPNACFQVLLTMDGPPGTANVVWLSGVSSTGFTINSSGTAGTMTVRWMAVGY